MNAEIERKRNKPKVLRTPIDMRTPHRPSAVCTSTLISSDQHRPSGALKKKVLLLRKAKVRQNRNVIQLCMYV